MEHYIHLVQIGLTLTFLRLAGGVGGQNAIRYDPLQSRRLLSYSDNENFLMGGSIPGKMKTTYQRHTQQDVPRMIDANEAKNNRILKIFTHEPKINKRHRSQLRTMKLKSISHLAQPRLRNIQKGFKSHRNLKSFSSANQIRYQQAKLKKEMPVVTKPSIDSNINSNDEIPCPKPCNCVFEFTVLVVNCSNKGLLSIPLLPPSSGVVNLQNNKINTISCHNFENLTLLTEIDLSQNTIRTFPKCSFSSLFFLKYLKLSNCGLEKLPYGAFSSLHNLIELDLSMNNIHYIERQLFLDMSRLETLNLYRNTLDTIKNCTFSGLGSLRFLSLQRNLLKYIPSTFEPLAFEGLSSLHSLHLQGNQQNLQDTFTYPDQALSRLSWLQELKLDGHPRPLGSGFQNLINLTRLDFSTDHQHDLESFCSMENKLPSNFFANLATRQPLTLNMSSCSVETIPRYLFRAVPTIHTLDLSGNHYLEFESFEIGSEGLQNSTLAVLNLSNIVKSGRIVEVKNTTFQYLRHTGLKVLILDDCQLMKISPKAIDDLPRTIEVISLQDNRIQYGQFLEPLLLLNNLKILKLSSQLHYNAGPQSINQSPGLNKFKIKSGKNDTNIYKHTRKASYLTLLKQNTHLKPDIDKKISIQFSLKKNGGKELDFCGDLESSSSRENFYWGSSVVPLPASLQYVYASDINTKYSVPRIDVVNNKALKYLDYSKNGAKCFGGPLTGLPSLQHLDLSYNWCLRVNPLMFSEMPSLTTLLLHHNVLGQSLYDDVEGVTFSTLFDLRTLDLRYNSLKQLSPRAFSQNFKLQILNLSHNDLSHFHPSLANVESLESLDLSVNNLESFSAEICHQFTAMKLRNPNFTVRLKANRFQCNCENLILFRFLLKYPKIFSDLEFFQCFLANGSVIHYDEFEEFIPYLVKVCTAETTFSIVLAIFITFSTLLMICSLYHYKRWQWTYLYYLGKSRLHIGSTFVTYKPVAHTFITYDQEERICRSFIREVVLPNLRRLGVSYVLGEVDFVGGPLASSIAGAVASTQKTLIFLSRHIFKDFYRQLELNLAIMHELHVRKRVVVPVLLLDCGHLLTTHQAKEVLFHHQDSSLPSPEQDAGGTDSEGESITTHESRELPVPNDSRQSSPRPRETPMDVIDMFPPEIAAYLQGQGHRCLVYDGDTEQFWSSLRGALFDEC